MSIDVAKILDEVRRALEKEISETKTLFDDVNRITETAAKQASPKIEERKPDQKSEKMPSIFDDETIINDDLFSDISEEIKPYSYAIEVGKNYLFRTVTMIYTGKLVQIDTHNYVVMSASWIPETLRWNESVRTGNFKEVEPYPSEKPVFLSRSAMLDIVEIPKLPREPK